MTIILYRLSPSTTTHSILCSIYVLDRLTVFLHNLSSQVLLVWQLHFILHTLPSKEDRNNQNVEILSLGRAQSQV